MNRINPGIMSSENHDWETSDELFHDLDEIFHFGFDAAATGRNTKCEKFLSTNDNALERLSGGHPVSWLSKIMKKYDESYSSSDNVAWLNPPYGSAIKFFAKMAAEQAQYFQTITVMLCPHRTDPQWFQDNVSYNQFAQFKVELHDRVRFKRPGTSSERSAPAFPSALVIYAQNSMEILGRFPKFGNLSKLGFIIDLALQRERMADYHGRRNERSGIVNITDGGKNIYISEEEFTKLKARPGVNIEPNLIIVGK